MIWAVVFTDDIALARRKGGIWRRMSVAMAHRLMSTGEAVEFPSQELADAALRSPN